ncbi:probable phosphoglycerate mutase [Lachnospiraceae bacterium XBB1006]|nr:probable phosphoglycerate mutase [Lachnospiraceae bacterium XBB1006]
MKVTIVRHGETDWNKLGKIQGQIDVPLNDYGRSIAKITRLAYEKENIHYDVVYSSPLMRAYETARILADPGQTIICDSRLKEISYGRYEGSNYQDILAGAPELLTIRDCFLAPQNYHPDETGECFSDFFHRTRCFLEELRNNYTHNESILVVCHGGTTRALLQAVEERPLSRFWETKHKNLCHSVVVWDKNSPFRIEQQAFYYYDLETRTTCQHGTPEGCVAPL